MIQLIVGHKGSGKTKAIVEMANKAVKESKGYVVVIEKDAFDVSNRSFISSPQLIFPVLPEPPASPCLQSALHCRSWHFQSQPQPQPSGSPQAQSR